jgi:hypothetical protein
LDLSPYIGKGFSPQIDHMIATVGVAGIDLMQTQSEVQLCDETEPILYGETFSPRRIRYQIGSRPVLEKICTGFRGDRVLEAMRWTQAHVIHPHFSGPTPGDRALSEERLIESGRGYCNEQSRVFIALCEVMEIPARLCFLWHVNNGTGHTATEVFNDGRWEFCDATYGVRSGVEARKLRGSKRSLANTLYREPLRAWIAKPPSDFVTGDASGIDPERGGDLFESVGICNYLIDGVEEVK